MLVLQLNMLSSPLHLLVFEGRTMTSEYSSVRGIFKPSIILPCAWKNVHMYLMTFPHASPHIIETLSEDAVTLRIDLSYIKIISVRLPRFRETFGQSAWIATYILV